MKRMGRDAGSSVQDGVQHPAGLLLKPLECESFSVLRLSEGTEQNPGSGAADGSMVPASLFKGAT